MTITQEITVSEIEGAKRLADAEAAWSTSSTDGEEVNPFEGASDKLAQVQVAFDVQQRRAKGTILRAAYGELGRHDAELATLADEIPRALADLNGIEQHETILRWKSAKIIAFNMGQGNGWEQYEKEFLNRRTLNDRIPLVKPPSAKWPDSLRFNEQDRDIIWRWKDIQSWYASLEQSRNAATDRRRALLDKFPELDGLG